MRLELDIIFQTDGDFHIENGETLIDPNCSMYKKADVKYGFMQDGEHISIMLMAYGDANACRWAARDLIEHTMCGLRTHKYYLIQDIYNMIIPPKEDLLWSGEEVRFHKVLGGNYEGTYIRLSIRNENPNPEKKRRGRPKAVKPSADTPPRQAPSTPHTPPKCPPETPLGIPAQERNWEEVRGFLSEEALAQLDQGNTPVQEKLAEKTKDAAPEKKKRGRKKKEQSPQPETDASPQKDPPIKQPCGRPRKNANFEKKIGSANELVAAWNSAFSVNGTPNTVTSTSQEAKYKQVTFEVLKAYRKENGLGCLGSLAEKAGVDEEFLRHMLISGKVPFTTWIKVGQALGIKWGDA